MIALHVPKDEQHMRAEYIRIHTEICTFHARNKIKALASFRNSRVVEPLKVKKDPRHFFVDSDKTYFLMHSCYALARSFFPLLLPYINIKPILLSSKP